MLWICLECTTAYSVGADGCPHCGSTEYAEEGTDMAKISRHGGATNKTTGVFPAHTTNADLVGRELEEITAAAAESVTSTTGGTSVQVDVEEPDAPVVVSPYDGMLRGELQDLCRTHGLSASGNKDEMIARLVAADDAKAEDDGELGTAPVDPA